MKLLQKFDSTFYRDTVYVYLVLFMRDKETLVKNRECCI